MDHEQETNDALLLKQKQATEPLALNFELLTNPPMRNNSAPMDPKQLMAQMIEAEESLREMVDEDLTYLLAHSVPKAV